MSAAGDEHGKLIVDGVTYLVTVQSLPTVVESYKTYDDINLVKTADIGQVRLTACSVLCTLRLVNPQPPSLNGIPCHGNPQTPQPDPPR